MAIATSPMSASAQSLNDRVFRSWRRSMRAANKAPRTIQSYEEAARLLGEHHPGKDFVSMTAGDIEDFIADQVERRSAASAAVRFRSLQQLFKYMAGPGEWREGNPMSDMSAPHVPEKPVPLLTDDQVRSLIATCTERTLRNRRDEAIIRVFYDTGIRVEEMAFIGESDIDFELEVIRVLGKGRRERSVPFGSKTGDALDKYMRLRDRHPGARTDRLWIGSRGPMTASGIYQMLERRAEQVGIEGMHPHRLRHTAAHNFLEAGGQEGDAMHLFGWKSREMLQRYGSAGQRQRAHAAHRRLGIGDRL